MRFLPFLAHYSKNIKGTNTNLRMYILAHHDNFQLQDNGHNSESYDFGIMYLLDKKK